MVMMMKISKCKKELARIISENGGWRDGAEWSAQDKNHAGRLRKVVFYCGDKPWIDAGDDYWGGKNTHDEFIISDMLIKNWHQTILSRAEYFHLYPAPNAKPRFCESVMRSIPEPIAKPTIEQLAADYRNKLDYANRKQDEADKANMDSDAALSELEAAIAEIGFAITPISAAEKEPELVITDWRDLQAGDLVWVEEEGGRVAEGEYEVLEVEVPDYDGKRTIRIRGGKGGQFWINYENGWRFISRP